MTIFITVATNRTVSTANIFWIVTVDILVIIEEISVTEIMSCRRTIIFLAMPIFPAIVRVCIVASGKRATVEWVSTVWRGSRLGLAVLITRAADRPVPTDDLFREAAPLVHVVIQLVVGAGVVLTLAPPAVPIFPTVVRIWKPSITSRRTVELVATVCCCCPRGCRGP